MLIIPMVNMPVLRERNTGGNMTDPMTRLHKPGKTFILSDEDEPNEIEIYAMLKEMYDMLVELSQVIKWIN